MDPISDVLTLLNIRGAFSSRFEACGPWALRFRSYRYVKIGAIVSGACWLTIDGEPPLRLSSGDCYLLASDRPYEVAGDLDIEPEDGHAVYRRFSGARTVRYGTAAPDAERTVIVGGSITLDEMTSALLLDCLPPVVRIPADSPPAQSLRPVLEMLSDETATEPLGAAVMIEHLTQILFVQALRAHLAGEETVPGWLGALNDPQIGAALTLMHQRATNRWTVAGLAAEVGMSRSSFALRFKTLVGLPPLDYLLHWRIRSAAEVLRAGERTVASVAAEWGYASESAFSNAFKRVTGQPPARYRTAKPAPPAAPPSYG
ncbi:AraC family transcriptional regulator [Streptosporangium subroseum]|uniref:AraC family transcriptional regulator n=1 Tax=Streptosporangium subroseum TaxID=106412 RepID=UPI00309118A3|nr:AraC family transcriptional regulator [Streptosporangium subroseum]